MKVMIISRKDKEPIAVNYSEVDGKDYVDCDTSRIDIVELISIEKHMIAHEEHQEEMRIQREEDLQQIQSQL